MRSKLNLDHHAHEGGADAGAPGPSQPGGVDLAVVREKLEATRGRRYWRSLDELARTPEFEEMLHREFPDGASEWWDGLTRRNFLRLAAASLALSGLTACTRQPVHEILPYINQPAGLLPGKPLFYATAMTQGGFARGILAKNREGHPIKIDGNPEHPMSRGRSDIWLQAAILDLYDPDRSQAVGHHGDISTWSAFLVDVELLLRELGQTKGAGLRFLTETITSPALTWQIQSLLKRCPQAKWHQFEPINLDNTLEGARIAFGEPLATHYRFKRAGVIVSLDSDFLYTHPAHLAYTRDFTDGRRVSEGGQTMNRLYVAESSPTVTGTMAEERLPVASSRIAVLTAALGARLGIKGLPDAEAGLSESEKRWVDAAAGELKKNRGAGIIIAGEWQPPAVHAMAHLMNHAAGNLEQTVFHTAPALSSIESQHRSLQALVEAMQSGKVETLIMLGGNPVYNSPPELDFSAGLERVKRSIHLSTHLDETSAVTTWHIPATHFLEAWGDCRGFDGTITLQQPLIAPLYGGKAPSELLGALME
ncbi:MAG TPA: TAT-variant-translocated molybdopterin oxidoreductase, partial [Verrucomicrobiae bacterium]|nr:TAT-variant-translocated molybdopterin oxidoreductase [Verrucomicrobiae bacterium]